MGRKCQIIGVDYGRTQRRSSTSGASSSQRSADHRLSPTCRDDETTSAFMIQSGGEDAGTDQVSPGAWFMLRHADVSSCTKKLERSEQRDRDGHRSFLCVPTPSIISFSGTIGHLGEQLPVLAGAITNRSEFRDTQNCVF